MQKRTLALQFAAMLRTFPVSSIARVTLLSLAVLVSPGTILGDGAGNAVARPELIVTTIAGLKPWPGPNSGHDRLAPCIAADGKDDCFACTYRGDGSIIWEFFPDGSSRALAVIKPDGTFIVDKTSGVSVKLLCDRISSSRNGALTTDTDLGFGFADKVTRKTMDIRAPRPVGLAFDASGSLIVSTAPIAVMPDGAILIAGTIVQKLNPDGTVTKVAGYAEGYRDGHGIEAQFKQPRGICAAPDGAAIIADSGNALIRRVEADGSVSTLAGQVNFAASIDSDPGRKATGRDLAAAFNSPDGVAMEQSGEILVVDSGFPGIRVIGQSGSVSTFAGAEGQAGWADGALRVAKFDAPAAIAVSPKGSIFIADIGAHTGRSTVRKISLGIVRATVARPRPPASPPGPVEGRVVTLSHDLGNLSAITTDANGEIFYAVAGDLWTGTVHMLTPNGRDVVIAGSAKIPIERESVELRLKWPISLTVDMDGTVEIADAQREDILQVTTDGKLYRSQTADGKALPGRGAIANNRTFSAMFGIDPYGQTVWRVTGNVIASLAGAPGEIGSVDGQGTEARFNNPRFLAVGPNDEVYIGEHSGALRVITRDGTVSTFAGIAGEPGFVDGPPDHARFLSIHGLAVGRDGVVYVADGNSIRMVTPAGYVKTIAGTNAGGPPDSYDHETVALAAARFTALGAIALDPDGRLLLTDAGSVRRIEFLAPNASP